MRRRLGSILWFGLALALSAGAAAQPHGAVSEQQGEAKFKAGMEARKQGDTKAALALFQASLALNKTAGTLLYLALCEEDLGLPASAAKHYQEAIDLLPPADSRVQTAKERKTAVETHIPTVRVRLDKGAPPATTVLLGERELAAYELDTEIRLDPGKYTVTASAPGSTAKRYEVTLEDGKKETLTVSPLPAPSSGAASSPAASAQAPAAPSAAFSAPPAPLAPPSSPLRMAGFVTLGVGGAALIAGAVTGGLALAQVQHITALCPGSGHRQCDPTLLADFNKGKALADAGTAIFVITGVAATAGATMLLISSRSKSAAPAVGLAVGPGTVSMQGRF